MNNALASGLLDLETAVTEQRQTQSGLNPFRQILKYGTILGQKNIDHM